MKIFLITDITFIIHIFSPITMKFVLFTKLQLTRNSQNILHPNQYIWSWTVA